MPINAFNQINTFPKFLYLNFYVAFLNLSSLDASILVSIGSTNISEMYLPKYLQLCAAHPGNSSHVVTFNAGIVTRGSFIEDGGIGSICLSSKGFTSLHNRELENANFKIEIILNNFFFLGQVKISKVKFW